MKAVLCLVAVLGGCSATTVVATVRSNGQPARGVVVAIECPQMLKAGGTTVLGTTGANGRLELRESAGGRWIHDGCTILVGSQRFPVKSVCAEYEGNHCVHAIVDTDLASSGDAGNP